jgi:hypothetical protein
MSWLELDDGILEHPKFIRAVKLGGSEAVHLWLGLRAYCGKHLTDGAIPKDMLDEVRGPTNPKKREVALAALFTVGLLDDGGSDVLMHDFLDWSSSREAVLAARERARERKAKSRGGHAVTSAVTPRVVTPAVTDPSPLHSSSTSTPLHTEENSEAPSAVRGLVPVRPRAPTNPFDAQGIPIAERARLVLEDPGNGAWSAPQTWPEVVAVAEALAHAAGHRRPKLGDMQRDAGVRVVLGHLADGWDPSELVRLAGAVARSKWWRDGGGTRGLSSLTAEVLRRTENEQPRRNERMDPEIAREIERTRALVARVGNGGA